MNNLVKPLWKSGLVACVGVLLMSGAAVGAPDYYVSGADHAVNQITSSADALLSGVGLWTTGMEIYEVEIFDSFDPETNTFGSSLGDDSEHRTTPGYLEITFTSPIPVTAGNPVYARVLSNLTNSYYVNTVSPPGPGVSHFSIDGSTWFDLYTDYGHAGLTWSDLGAAAPANFVIDPIISAPPGITATKIDGNWDITNQQFNDQTDTFTLGKKANELEPFVAELEVTGGMSPIFITEEVINDTGEDWIGYGFQLGFWDEVNQRFVSSTVGDELAFRQGYNNSGQFDSPTFSEDSLYFDGALIPAGGTATFNLMIDLPGDPEFIFALRQYAIPEPGTAMLLGIAGLMLLGFRRRR